MSKLHKTHTGFWLKTKAGHAVHILGDRTMPKRTANALGEMVDACCKAVKTGKKGQR